MHLAPLTINDCTPWAGLLAHAFNRTPEAMEHLLIWLHQGYPVTAWGAWDQDQLVAQYACLGVNLQLPNSHSPVKVGMSLNMCVHPAYRGQGLIKQVAQPVYHAIRAEGAIAGIGFSNAEGVQVDRNSKGYGYQVLGHLPATLGWLKPLKSTPALELLDTLPPDFDLIFNPTTERIQLVNSARTLMHRYACHPFRQYRYALWREAGIIRGLVVYRPVRLRGLPGVALLAAYSDDLTELLWRWSNSIRRAGFHLVHLLASPGAVLLTVLQKLAFCVTVPSRSPCYLTAKPLGDEIAALQLLDFARWDCTGGDIL
jgi:GNAT superfamily N-acetyltransferase